MDTLTRRPDGQTWWRIPDPADPTGLDYLTHAYSIAIEPRLREIRSPRGAAVGYITRNRYNAEVLNTPHLLILDVDVQDDRGRCPSAAMYQVVLAAARVGRELDVVAELAERLEAHADPETGWRIYRTRNGYRLIETTTRFEWAKKPELFPDEMDDLASCRYFEQGEKLIALMRHCLADEAYLRICLDQQLFRARLTPKPWRAHRVHGPRACRFLRAVRSQVVHPDLRPLLDEHDRVTDALAPDPADWEYGLA